MAFILIIDDDKWYRESIANSFSGGQILTAGSPEEAMSIIDKNIPDMIYLDLELGTRNGLTVLNELQSWSDTRTVPIVLLSTDGKRLDIGDWRRYGVVEIFDKGELTPEMLNRAMKRVDSPIKSANDGGLDSRLRGNDNRGRGNDRGDDDRGDGNGEFAD
jgi:CheY-like chemotaxis protein